MQNTELKTYDDFKNAEIIEIINPAERDRYLDFLKKSYENDIEHCKFSLIKFPRWSIISGYYAMHNISKLFLAEKYNLKISKKWVHRATIVAMSHVIMEDALKAKIIRLLQEANKIYESVNPKDWNITKYLIKGRKEREKTQYYTGSAFNEQLLLRNADELLNEIAKPYIKIISGLMK